MHALTLKDRATGLHEVFQDYFLYFPLSFNHYILKGGVVREHSNLPKFIQGRKFWEFISKDNLFQWLSG